MPMRRLSLVTTIAILLAGCNSAEETAQPVTEEVAQPVPVLTPAAAPTAAPDGTALEPGEWAVTEDEFRARAAFGTPGGQPLLSLECFPAEKALRMFLYTGATAPEAWRLDAGGEAARIDFTPTAEQTPEIAAAINQSLAIILAMGNEGEVFTLTSPQGQRRQFPTNPGIRRVIASCS